MKNFLAKFLPKAPPIVSKFGSGGLRAMFLPHASIDYEARIGRGKKHLNTIVAMCADYMQSQFAEAPLIVERKAGDKWRLDDTHEFTRLMARPNNEYSWSTLAAGISVAWLLEGNVYILAWPGKAGKPAQLWFLPPHLVTPMNDGEGQDGSKLVTHYRYDIPGQGTIDFPKEFIIHLRRGIDPEDMMLGFSPVKAAVREIYGDNAAATYSAAIVDNFGIPSVVFSPDGDQALSEEEAKTVSASIREGFSRENAGRSGFVPVAIKADRLAFSPKELDLGQLSDRLVARICGACGFDPMVLGLPSSNKTYSNRESAEQGAYNRVILSAHRSVAEQFTVLLMEKYYAFGSYRFTFDYRDVAAMQDDIDKLHSRWRAAWVAGLITEAEFRENVGLPFASEHNRYVYDVGQGMSEEPEDSQAEPESESKTVADRIRAAAAERQMADTMSEGG